MTSLRQAAREVLAMIGEKWVALIVVPIGHKTLRFGELERICEGIFQKMPTQILRELERDSLVVRTLYADRLPLKVEYQLTKLGRSLLPVVKVSKLWTEEHLHEIKEGRVNWQSDRNDS